MRASRGLRLKSGIDDGFDPLGTVSRLPASARSNLPQPFQSSGLEPLSPESDRFAIDLIFGGQGRLGPSGGDAENDAAAERYLLGCPEGGEPLIELPSLVLGQDDRGKIARHV